MSDSIADDILRNGYERWLRLEEAKAEVSDDIKELMAELKGHGFTPKAVRESFRRVRNADNADQQEHDAIVDLYVASLTRVRPAPAHEKTLNNFRSYAEEKGRGEVGIPASETGEITDNQESVSASPAAFCADAPTVYDRAKLIALIKDFRGERYLLRTLYHNLFPQPSTRREDVKHKTWMGSPSGDVLSISDQCAWKPAFRRWVEERFPHPSVYERPSRA